MAIGDSYATPEEYRGSVGIQSTADDADIQLSLTAAARVIDRKLWLAPGAFRQSAASEARYFDGNDRARLPLRDERGMVHPIATIDAEGIAVDTGLDDAWATTFDTGDSWAIGTPVNAAVLAQAEPFTALQLLELVGASASVGELLAVFPLGVRNVRITGTWGWAAVPEGIKLLTIKLARDLRDGVQMGGSTSLQMLDQNMPVSGDTWRAWLAVEAVYSHAMTVVA